MAMGDGGSRPIPDPTLLTTQQLNNSIAALKELMTTRLDAMDKAVELLNANQTRVPTEIDKQIAHLKELIFERFDTNDLGFALRDDRVKQDKLDTKSELASALAAAEKAVQKQNESFTVSINKSEAAMGEQIRGLNGKIDDLKERLTRGEGLGSGRASIAGPIWAVVGAVIAAVLTALALGFLRVHP
jgi:CHASE3 domain sensor protein